MKKFYFTVKGKKFAEIVTVALNVEKELSWVPTCSNGMDKIVDFFKITSPAQDKFLELTKGFKFKKEKQKFISEFSKFLENSGRCKYGWNRTEKGEIPNSSSVFINMKVPYDEMFYTRSVADHLSRRSNPKGEIDCFVKEERHGIWNETGLVENDFVNPFMSKNYQFLLSVIKELPKN